MFLNQRSMAKLGVNLVLKKAAEKREGSETPSLLNDNPRSDEIIDVKVSPLDDLDTIDEVSYQERYEKIRSELSQRELMGSKLNSIESYYLKRLNKKLDEFLGDKSSEEDLRIDQLLKEVERRK